MAKRSKKSMLEGIGDMISQIGGIEGIKSVCILQPDGHRKCLPRQFKSGRFLSAGDKKKRVVAQPKGRAGQGRGKVTDAKINFKKAVKFCAPKGPGSGKQNPYGNYKECMTAQLGARTTPKKTATWAESTRTGRAPKHGPRRQRKSKKS